MNIIVCVDDDFGMMFNNRRQSRDKTVCEDVLMLTKNNRLLMNAYSEALFSDIKNAICVDEDFLLNSKASDYCFIENVDFSAVADKIEKIVLYRWNRKYPSDKKFNVGLINNKKLVERIDFKGNSHEKITREIYE